MQSIDVILPLAFLCLSVGAKKLGRGVGWEDEDFAFGVELAIATISSVFIEIVEVAKKIDIQNYDTRTLAHALISYTVFAVVMLLVFSSQIIIVQEQKGPKLSLPTKRWMLWGASNVVGVGLFLLFIFKIKTDLPCQ